MQTIWDKLYDFYRKHVPYHSRPGNLWWIFRGWAWDRFTTVKPRTLEYTWCDRRLLIRELVFETAAKFLETEGPKTQAEWDWQKEHNPNFYDAWHETQALIDWWKNSDMDGDEYEEQMLNGAVKLIKLSDYYWT